METELDNILTWQIFYSPYEYTKEYEFKIMTKYRLYIHNFVQIN